MEMITQEVVNEGEQKGLTPAIIGKNIVADEKTLGRLFRAYFNNKMTMLVFLCSALRHKPQRQHIRSACLFLDDIYRHMLEGDLQRKCRRKLLWLKGFFRKLPHVRASQRVRALERIHSLYGVLGMEIHNKGRFFSGEPSLTNRHEFTGGNQK